jgi:hypothetical protein
MMSPIAQTTPIVGPSLQQPAGWVDSTELSVKQVEERLAQSHHRSLRQIGCEPVEGGLVLWGTVTSYYSKQLAQALAGSVVGLERIKNRIVVELNPKPR